jgi:hypothetical protein
MVWQEKGAVKYFGRSVIFLLQVVCSVSDFRGSGPSIHSIDLGQANSTVHIKIA